MSARSSDDQRRIVHERSRINQKELLRPLPFPRLLPLLFAIRSACLYVNTATMIDTAVATVVMRRNTG